MPDTTALIFHSIFIAWDAFRPDGASSFFTEVDKVTKKERIAAEIEKTKAKRQELTERIAELERRYKEEETFEMHELLRKAKVTPEELAEILEKSPLTRKNREA